MSLDVVLARIQQLQPVVPATPAPAAAPAAEPTQTDTNFATQLDSALQTDTPAPAAQPVAAPAPATTAPAASPLHDVGCCCCCCGRPTSVTAPVAATTAAATTPAATTVAATAAAATTPAATTASAETAQPPATQPLTTVGGEPTAYDPEIEAAGARYGVDPNLVKAVIEQESGFDPTATSGVGAQGLMQLMPETARGLGISDAYDPAQAIDAGTRYLKEQLDRFGGDESLALAAYNAGPAAVARFGGVPPYGETQNYVQSVLANLTSFKNTDQ